MNKNFALSQGLRTANTILEGVWKLDLNGDTRYPDYEMYVFYHKNKRYQFDFHPKKPLPYNLNNLSKTEYYFLTDQGGGKLEEINFDETTIITNISTYNELFLLDKKDSFENTPIKVIHLSRKNQHIEYLDVWDYELSDYVINLHGLGEGASQPMNGYIYRRAQNIPKEILSAISQIQSIKVLKVSSLRCILSLSPNNPTKMYLIKGDKVEVLEEQGNWLKIRYYGKKVVEGWIKRSDVE
ncbi:SH3 domain-containing protein [Flectobacillus roseus]|uniref:SH3 domain-containing protein n=1 Tax=Flectobacillus roseus TaxID=502259 RepID=UPI00363168C7